MALKPAAIPTLAGDALSGVGTQDPPAPGLPGTLFFRTGTAQGSTGWTVHPAGPKGGYFCRFQLTIELPPPADAAATKNDISSPFIL
jgi:hypothetical protein